MLLKRGIEKNIMLLPGKGFMPGLSDNTKCNYMRAAFSVAKEEDFDVAFARLAQLIKDEQKIWIILMALSSSWWLAMFWFWPPWWV